jgi:hypothetical protein
MTGRLWVRTVLALVLAGWALWVLEGARRGLEFTNLHVGPTPVTRITDGSGGPPVVVAHGFAGSRQMMLGYGQVLAQAGYTVHIFDFEGHGRHPIPMSGDVNAIEGTTRLLVEQTLNVIDFARNGDTPVALLGHSMATDVLVRSAAEAEGVGPLVLLSAFSLAITPERPRNMLLITGAWEPGLRDFALEAARMVDPQAGYGDVAQEGGVIRRAVLAPMAEHVSILHSRVGRKEALNWLNRYYERDQSATVPQTGWALLLLLAAITALAAPLARLWPKHPAPAQRIGAGGLAAATLLPALVAPAVAVPLDTGVLPVLVADYLALHLLVYGVVQLAVLARLGRVSGRLHLPAIAAIIVLALGVFGFALDRYGANFWPTGQRLWIIAALAIGTLPFMLGDSLLASGAPLWQRIAARVVFLGSLAIAIVLDFDRLFFLAMIAPVILLFWLTIGAIGRAFSRRLGPISAGVALGLVLAWALGVSFPLFQA